MDLYQLRTVHNPKSVTHDAAPWPWWLAETPATPRWQWFVVCLAASLCTLLMTWPVAFQLSEGVITTPARTINPDLGQNVWNVWHFMNTWQRTDQLWSGLVTAPLQVNLVAQSYGVANLWLSLPSALLAGPIVGANTIILFGFWAGIVAMTVVAYRVCRSMPLAFVIGCLFVLTPAHLKNIEWAADENAAVHWLVLVHLGTIWWLRRPTAWRSSALACILVVVSLSSGYSGLFGVIYMALLVAVTLWAHADRQWRTAALAWAAVVAVLWAGVMALLTSELTNPLHVVGITWDAPQDVIVGGAGLRDWVMRQTIWLHVVSLADLVTPLASHPLWGAIPAVAAVRHPSEMGGYLGIFCLALFIWTLRTQPTSRHIGIVTGVLVLLACGLDIKLWYDQPFPALPGLFWVLDLVGVFRNASRPGLFLLYAWIPLLLVVTYGLARIERRWLQLALCAAMVIDFAPPQWVVVPMRTSAAAALIPRDGPAGAVLTLPIKKNAQQPLNDQLCHQRPIVAGYLARTPAYPVAWPAFIVRADPKRRLLPQDGLTAMQNMGIRYVIAQNQPIRAALAAMSGSGVLQVAERGTATVYAVPDGTKPVLTAGAGWWDEESAAGRVWRWTTSTAELVVLSSQPRHIQLVLHASSTAATVTDWELDGRHIGTVAIAAQPSLSARILRFTVPAGRSVVRIHAPAKPDVHGRAVAIAFTQLYVRSAQPVRDARVASGVHISTQPSCVTASQ